jgi:hypothetical protein
MISEDIDYDWIKQYLHRGEIKELAKKAGLSPDHGYKILNKKSRNISFVESCYERAIERATRFVQFEEQKKELNKKLQSL